MYDTEMNRMTARVTFGRDYRNRPAPKADPMPTGGGSSTGPTFAFPKPRRRRWFRR